MPHTMEAWMPFALWGAGGALIGSMVREDGLQLPRVYVKKNGTGAERTYIDPGFLVALIAGAVLAAWIDGRPQTALAYGVACGFAGPAALRQMLGGFVDRTLAKGDFTLSKQPQTAADKETST